MAGPIRRGGRTAQKTASSGFRGEEGRRRMQEEEERAKARREQARASVGMPFRFFCPPEESRELIVVDEAPDFFRFEHNLRNARTGRWDIFTSCINEHANCPVCKAAERDPYYAMYLTVIDLTPYETKAGETVEWSKKLLVIKPAQHKKLMRIYEREGTLRGALLRMTRDSEKDASIGNDIEFLEFVSEEELASYERIDYYTDKDDKEHEREVIGYEPFDYDELFPEQTEAQLRAIVGGRPEAGSRDEERSAGRRGRGDKDDWEDTPPARGGARRRLTPRAREVGDEVDDPGQEAEAHEEADTPRRAGASRAPVRSSARPAARTTATRRAEEPEEAEQETPRRGTVARRPAKPDPEETPRRGATSLADRRRELRGR